MEIEIDLNNDNMKAVFEFIIKYIWQAPQMLAALIWYICRKKYITAEVEGKFYTVYRGANRGGVALGDKIFLSDYYSGEQLALVIAHESGHVKQSMMLGPLYLFVIGIPSIIWAAIHNSRSKKSYYWFYTEAWANKLGGVGVNESGVLTWKHLIR